LGGILSALSQLLWMTQLNIQSSFFQYGTSWQPLVASHVGARGAAQPQMPTRVP
jgi:hypothetical protein